MRSNELFSHVQHLAAGTKWLVLVTMLSLLVAGGRAAFAEFSQADKTLDAEARQRARLRWHSEHGLNEGRLLGGSFEIGGAPAGYEAGKTYLMKVRIAHPGKTKWAFELSARFSDSGKQAGSWTPMDGSTQVRSESGIQYVRETPGSAWQGAKDGPMEFLINWVAPATQEGLIIFRAVGNAESGQDDPTGDFVYSAGGFSRPVALGQPVLARQASSGSQQPVPEPVEISLETLNRVTRLQEVSRMANLSSPVDLKKGSVEILIQHRFLESISSAGAGNAFGVDSGANIDLGVNYGLTDRLSVGVARTRFDQIVDLSGSFEIRSARESQWKLSFVGGVEGKHNFHKVYSPYLQLAGCADIGPVRVNVVPTAVFNTRPEDRLQFDLPRAINPGSNSTFALGLGTDIALNRRFSLMAEYVPRLTGFGGFDERRDHVAGGFIIRTWGHVFAIFVGRSRDFTPSKYAVNAEENGVSLGFNIYRRIR